MDVHPLREWLRRRCGVTVQRAGNVVALERVDNVSVVTLDDGKTNSL